MRKHFASIGCSLLSISPARLILTPLALFAVGVVLLLPRSAALADPQTDAERGHQLFDKRCGGCHALDNDKEGPRLRGVYSRKAGTVPSFKYSDALAKSGTTWDEVSLDMWLTDPDKFIADADMDFHLDKADERAAVIAYLKSLSSR